MEKKSIGKFISSLRKANGYTQEELGELLNVSNKTISSWENDNSCPDLSMIPLIADIFNVSCDELLRGEKDRNTNIDTTRSDKVKKNMIKKLLYKYSNMFYISIGIFVASFILLFVGVTVSHIVAIVLLVIGILGYLTGVIFSIITFNNAKSKVNEEEDNHEYYRLLNKKALFLKCLYSFLILTPLFCYFNDRDLLNDSKYKLKEEEYNTIYFNYKLKQKHGLVAIIVSFICLMSLLVINNIHEANFYTKDNKETTMENLYTFKIRKEGNSYLIVYTDSSHSSGLLVDDEELDLVKEFKEGDYYLDLPFGTFEEVEKYDDQTQVVNGVEFYLDFSNDKEEIVVSYKGMYLFDLQLECTNKGTFYYNFNYTDMYVYEFRNDRYVLVNSSFSYSYKEDIIPIIVVSSMVVIIVDVVIYFVKKKRSI